MRTAGLAGVQTHQRIRPEPNVEQTRSTARQRTVMSRCEAPGSSLLPPAASSLDWDGIIALHDAAVARYAADALPLAAAGAAWDAPTAPGKWSPAEITLHLIMALEAGAREIETGEAMVSRTRWYHRVVIRATLYRRLLSGGAFPTGARAPRETRPPRPTEEGVALIARLRHTAAQLVAIAGATRAARPGFRFSHPYFGRITLADAVYVSARHIDHHRAQLPVGARSQRSGSRSSPSSIG